MQHKRSTLRASGATLIELLVLIGVIAILTLITIVGLRSVKQTQLDMKDLHNLRLSGMDILTYAHDNDERFLSIGLPDDPSFHRLYGGPNPMVGYAPWYWGININWNSVLSRLTGARNPHWQSPYGVRQVEMPNIPGLPEIEPPDPSSPAHATALSLYVYSRAFVTKPELWVNPAYDLSESTIPTYFERVRVSQVKFPASKGLMIHLRPPASPDHHNVVFVDNSAASLPHERFRDPVPRPMGNPNRLGAPVLDTASGYLGADR